MPPLDDAPATRRDFETLAIAVKELTKELRDFRSEMAATYVRKDVYLSDQSSHAITHKEHSEAIESLNSWKDWGVRLVVGAVITALLGMVLVQGWR